MRLTHVRRLKGIKKMVCKYCGTHGCDDCMMESQAHDYFRLELNNKVTLKDKVKTLNKKLGW